jgi:beta-N-acetylhexosaminidase
MPASPRRRSDIEGDEIALTRCAAVAKVSLRRHKPDDRAVFQLWQMALGSEWPLTRALFQQVIGSVDTARPQGHFVAVEGRAIVGFVATQAHLRDSSASRQGNIVALYIAPAARRRGLGSTLHHQALEHLRSAGVRKVQLGGGEPRFWCGVPTTLPQAVPFFQRHGWTFTETSYDMIQSLDRYATPPAVYQRAAQQGIALKIADEQDLENILAFEGAEFPEWLDGYRQIASLGDYQDLLLAYDARRRLVGALTMYAPQSNPARETIVWQTLLGERPGALGSVGVAKDMGRLGIGSALVARGSELLKERGAAYSFIEWTWALDFYGRLGYTTWRSYEMSWRDL